LAFAKEGDIWGFLWPIVKSPRPPLRKGEIFWPLRKGGDILRLFSDRMPARIVCRKVSENSRTFPPFEKGGSGGISHFLHPRPLHHYPINLLHHRFRFYHYLPAVKIPPAPFTKGGDIRGFLWPDEIPPAPFGKGGDIRGLLWPIVKSPPSPLY
jgi:hypothetical protein